MNSLLFKLAFDAPVHFGSSDGALSLYSSEEHFRADTLFSALCHTAIRSGNPGALERLCSCAHNGRLILSDAMPWRGDTLFLPKPIVSSEHTEEIPARLRKEIKKLKWISVTDFEAFSTSVAGGAPFVPKESPLFGVQQVFTKAAVQDGEDARPYDVGTFRFYENCGLWFLCLCDEDDAPWLEQLVTTLGCSGIGGKVSSGYGAFHVDDLIYLDDPFDEQTQWLADALHRDNGCALLLTTALPDDAELESALDGACYRLVRRGGFVQSEEYSDEPMKKETQYYLAAGSTVRNRFCGSLFDVGKSGDHPVFRYSKPLFLGVAL